MILGIAVDLSALPYLLRLLPGSTPSERPRSVVPSWPRPCRSGKNHEQRSGVSPVGKGGRSQTVSPPWLGLPVGNRIVALACHYVSGLAQEARVVATPSAGPSFLQGSGSIRDPGFMNLTQGIGFRLGACASEDVERRMPRVQNMKRRRKHTGNDSFSCERGNKFLQA